MKIRYTQSAVPINNSQLIDKRHIQTDKRKQKQKLIWKKDKIINLHHEFNDNRKNYDQTPMYFDHL